MLHTGRHEVAEIPASVEHIHTDPFSEPALREALASRTFDLTIAAYGRLRRIAEVMAGRTGRFLSIGGAPAYRGYMNPAVLHPQGLPIPAAEDSPLLTVENEDTKGWRVVKTEEAVFANHPSATHFRYPHLYGPYQLAPREWSIVRRIIDGRRAIIVPEDGLSINHCGYVENAAHAVLLAIDRPEASAGQIYNCGDARVLTLRQVIEVIARALGHELEIVSRCRGSLRFLARPLILAVPDHASRARSHEAFRTCAARICGCSRARTWIGNHRALAQGASARSQRRRSENFAGSVRLSRRR